ncbi:hypothetical protein OSB04_023731 [Centaurea solstitialis]|uniref:Integrase catalytic domain-containing protein n=1 Tax=Centaurea solstitialis TaxID=347529 RepID=A0AA38WBE2_9ASTR|nr:hypothetical protein OSB04_023731 [Centaurea solstitialis]
MSRSQLAKSLFRRLNTAYHDPVFTTAGYDGGLSSSKAGFTRRETLRKNRSNLRVGEGTPLIAEAVGSYSLSLPSGLVLELDNYIPKMIKNVLSFHLLVDQVNLQDNNNEIYHISKRSKDIEDQTYLWHCRLGHINKKHVELLLKGGFLGTFDYKPFHNCESCLSGKMTKQPFNKENERATDLLEIIHTDVCGPSSHVARGGYRYFINFTDDFSRYGYVYLMRHKSESFERFREFQNEIQNKLGRKIKFLRSDRGGEYLSDEFDNHLMECGIVSQLTPPYTPQMNGVSERRNRTLLDMQWKGRMINFLDLLDDKWMVSITEGPIRPTVTVVEVARTEVTPYLPAYEVEKPYDMFSHEQCARAAIDKRALTLLTMALPNDMFTRVDNCKDARAMWLGIEQQMQGGDKALEGQRENAMNAYESFCAREGETLTETYNRLNICVNDLRRLGLEKNKYEVNVKFLKRINKLWQSVTISIQVSQNLGQLGLHDLYSMMLPHEETLFGKTEKKIDPPTLGLMSNRGSSSHENYTVEEPVVLEDGLTEEEMFQLENSFALMAKFRGNPKRFNRFRQGPQFVGGQSNQGGYQSRESFQRNDQGRSNNYQQRDSSGYNHLGSYQDRRQGYNNNQQQQRDPDYNSNNYHGNSGNQAICTKNIEHGNMILHIEKVVRYLIIEKR